MSLQRLQKILNFLQEKYKPPPPQLALHTAVYQNDLETIKLIHTDSTITYTELNEALLIAADQNHLEILQELLKDPRSDPTSFNNGPILQSIKKGYSLIFHSLWSHPSINPSDLFHQRTLLYTARYNRLDLLQYLLLDPRLDPSIFDHVIFRIASEKGYIEMVRYLLKDPRIDYIAKQNYAIRHSVYNHHPPIFRLLCSIPSIYETLDLNSLLLDAVTVGSQEIYLLLINDPHIDLSINGKLIFDLAAVKNYADIISFYLKLNFLNSKDIEGAFNAAVVHGHTEAVEKLISFVELEKMYESIYLELGPKHRGVLELILTDERINPLKNFDIQKRVLEDAEILRYCLKNPKFDPTWKDNYLLKKLVKSWGGSSKYRILALKELLKDPRIDPSIDDKVLVCWSHDSSPDIFKLLVQHESCVIDNIGLKMARQVGVNNRPF